MNEELLIDMSGIMDEEAFHEYVSKKLNFPGYYGHNLNALRDCITDEDQSSMPKNLIVEGLVSLKGFLPELHDCFVECLQDYIKEFPDREVVFRQGKHLRRRPRAVKPIHLTELEKLPTPRILSYLKKLQQCEESIELSDWSTEEVSKAEGIVFKSSTEWAVQHKYVKSVLATRSNFENS